MFFLACGLATCITIVQCTSTCLYLLSFVYFRAVDSVSNLIVTHTHTHTKMSTSASLHLCVIVPFLCLYLRNTNVCSSLEANVAEIQSLAVDTNMKTETSVRKFRPLILGGICEFRISRIFSICFNYLIRIILPCTTRSQST